MAIIVTLKIDPTSVVLMGIANKIGFKYGHKASDEISIRKEAFENLS